MCSTQPSYRPSRLAACAPLRCNRWSDEISFMHSMYHQATEASRSWSPMHTHKFSSCSRIAIAAAAAILMLGGGFAAAAQQPYQVLDHWTIGGTGGWDYLLADPSAHLLYVTHGPRVEVIDTSTGKPVGAITGLKGTHGIAPNPDAKFGYISDRGG